MEALAPALAEARINVESADAVTKQMLMEACANGQIETVKMLLESGASANAEDVNGCNLLQIAAQNYHLEVVKLLLNKGASCDNKAISIAATQGHLEVMSEILDRSINITGGLLLKAAWHGIIEAIQLLLERGADATGLDGTQALNYACQGNHMDAVELLLRSGAKDNHWGGVTVLHIAARKGHMGVVKWMLDQGNSVDLKTDVGWTPLFYAAYAGRFDMAKYLVLERNARIELATSEGYSPLHIASKHGYLDIVQLLLQRGVNINLVNSNGETPLYLAAEKFALEFPGRFDVVQFLATKIQSQDDMRGLTHALTGAITEDRLDVAAFLLHLHPKIAEEPLALHNIAIKDSYQSNEVMKLLIANSAPINWIHEYRKHKTTALHWAVRTKQPSKVWQLVLNGADISIPFIFTRHYQGDSSDEDDDDIPTSQTVWELCGDDMLVKEALFHFWTPQSHKIHPKWVRDAILCVLWVSKQQKWPFDKDLLHKILSYIAYGWYKPCLMDSDVKKV